MELTQSLAATLLQVLLSLQTRLQLKSCATTLPTLDILGMLLLMGSDQFQDHAVSLLLLQLPCRSQQHSLQHSSSQSLHYSERVL